MTKFNYSIDTTLLPEVWLTWMTKDGRVWMDKGGNKQNHAEWWMSYTGEHSLTNRYSDDGKTPFGVSWATRNKDKIWVNAGSQFHYVYAKYHEDIDRLELAAVKYDTTRQEGKHEWMYAGDRLFIGKDKSVINQWGMETPSTIIVKKDTTEDNIRHAIQAIMRQNHTDNFLPEFKKFLGRSSFIIGNGTSVPIQYNWHFTKWFESKVKTRTKGKSQRLIDELIQMPLNSIDGLEYRFPVHYEYEYRGRYRAIPNIIYFERINDDWSVFRGLVRNKEDKFDEVWRAYIGDDGTNQIATNSNGEWISSAQPKGYWFCRGYYLANLNEAEEKCNRVKYIAPIFREANNLDALLTTLKFPIIEQLYKLGHKQMALCVARSHTPKATIKEMFGDYYKEKEKSVLRQIGMNKCQLDSYYDIYASRRYNRGEVIRIMRIALGDDLSRIDNDTYERYLAVVDGMIGEFWYRSSVKTLNVDQGKFWRNVVRLGEKNNGVYRLINDTISEYHRLDSPRPEIDWLFDDYSDVVRTHDALMALRQEQEATYRAYYNMEEAERHRLEDEKRKRVDENRKHYEYEDDNFIIRLPKDVNEIVSEGSRQSICIGGYTTRHSRGETNLFFLRRKDAESVPFYAIEMRDGKIIQIHGFGNKWLGNDPDAIPTVVRWLRKHGIQCDPTILTCTARGYGRTRDYIAMPVVD